MKILINVGKVSVLPYCQVGFMSKVPNMKNMTKLELKSHESGILLEKWNSWFAKTKYSAFKAYYKHLKLHNICKSAVGTFSKANYSRRFVISQL